MSSPVSDTPLDSVKRTAAEAVQALTRSVRMDRRQRLAGELVQAWCLTREELDEASADLGMPPLSDEEWELLESVRPPWGP